MIDRRNLISSIKSNCDIYGSTVAIQHLGGYHLHIKVLLYCSLWGKHDTKSLEGRFGKIRVNPLQHTLVVRNK